MKIKQQDEIDVFLDEDLEISIVQKSFGGDHLIIVQPENIQKLIDMLLAAKDDFYSHQLGDQ